MKVVRIDIQGGVFSQKDYSECSNIRNFWTAYKKYWGYKYTYKHKVKGQPFTHIYMIRGDHVNGMGIAFI